MSGWSQVVYTYDGTFAGFLSCVFDSYAHREQPAAFSTFDEPQSFLWPQRAVETDEAHANRVLRSFGKLGGEGARLAVRGFLTCLEEKELHLWQFLKLGYEVGPRVGKMLTDCRVDVLRKAVWHLEHEAHLYKGFVRFSDQDNFLVAQIEPKNWVLPLLSGHFTTRFNAERFLIFDRTHSEALVHQPGQWDIIPMEGLELAPPGQEELQYRRLWRRFYDTIAIEGRYNPKCRMTHMPKRYWAMMTEFQTEESALPGQMERRQKN